MAERTRRRAPGVGRGGRSRAVRRVTRTYGSGRLRRGANEVRQERRAALAPIDELDVALRTVDNFGTAVQAADAKAGMLGALLGLVLAGLINEVEIIRATLSGDGALLRPAGFMFLAFATSLAVAGAALALTQVPRLRTCPAVRWLALPAMATGMPVVSRAGRPTAACLRDEAWYQAEVLAAIAMRKFRCLRISLLASGVCVVAFVGWIGAMASETR